MALKAIVDTVDGLPADVAKEYAKGDDGKFRLQVTPVDGLALENVDGLKTALGKERESVRKLTEATKTFEGLDADKARDALKKVEEMANWTPEEKVKQQIEAIKTAMLDSHGKEKSGLQKKLDALTKQLNGALITSAATQALVKHKARGDGTLLLPHVERQVRMRETENGQFMVEVVDENGNVRVNGAGKNMSIEELVESMKKSDAFAPGFDGSGASGSGAAGGGGTPKPGTPFVLSPTDAKDPAKYRAAKEAAAKAGQQLQIQD